MAPAELPRTLEHATSEPACLSGKVGQNRNAECRQNQSCIMRPVVGPALAAAGLTTAKENAQMKHVNKLLSAMLHPEVAQRMTAEEMKGLQWLQEAAAVPPIECAVKIQQPESYLSVPWAA